MSRWLIKYGLWLLFLLACAYYLSAVDPILEPSRWRGNLSLMAKPALAEP
ncbi:MAG: hypothetical protein AAF495_28320 [Pseudomonadota bacterium]